MLIYKTTNLVNGKIYVGKDGHGNDNYLGSGTILKQAIKKYGRNNFKKETLEVCDGSNWVEREIYWISKLDARNKDVGYNIAEGGENPPLHKGKEHYLYGKHLPKETKLKMSATKKNQFKTGYKSHNYGKKVPDKTKLKISNSLKGRFSGVDSPNYGRTHSKETRLKMLLS